MNKRRSIFLSAISGNVLEYYDFTVYAVFSLAIGQAFFPSGSQVIQTLSSLSVFAVGFIMRPIGGIIFGFIADKYGRRVSLIISMLGMTMTTFTIGLIPGYSDIGYGAPILLVMMRLIQGLCISGEGAGAAIFILEHYQNLRPGFTAGIVHASNIAGTLLASFVGIILEQLFPELEFAWRFAFILGGIMGIIGFYFRLRVSETPIFEMLAEKKRTLKMPFMHVIRSSWPAMLITCCLGGSASSLVYIIKTYPAFMLLASLEIWKQIVALTTIAMLGGFIAGTAYIFIISLFSAEERFTGVAFSYNLGVALFGGTSAVISRWLVEVTHLYHAPAFYVMITSLLFLAMAYSMKKTIIRLIDTNLKPK